MRSQSQRLAATLDRHAGCFIGAVVIVTAALAVPFVTMSPTQTASPEPGGPVFEARRLIAERFANKTHRVVFVVEARDGGNLLARQALRELLRNAAALRAHAELAPRLLTYRDPRTAARVHGLTTVADAVDGVLRASGQRLATATEEAVAGAVNRLLGRFGPTVFGLGEGTRRDPGSDRWHARGMIIAVAADAAALGGSGQPGALGAGSQRRERFARHVQRVLRGEQQHLRLWGLAIDANLTAREQGRAAGPYIGLTVFAVLLIVGLVFRSYWAVAVTGCALGALIVWLRGLSNLIGLKEDQVLTTIVPIAMIAFGVDFAFHAIGRCREARRRSAAGPRRAFVVGLGAALTALVVAMASDAAAFLSNTTTGIESLIQFGIAAALATGAAFLLLGLATPAVLSRVEARVTWRPRGPVGWVLAGTATALAAGAVTSAVVLAVFVRPAAGVVALGGYALLFIALPTLLGPRLLRAKTTPTGARAETVAGSDLRWLGKVVRHVARSRLVLPAAAVITVVSAYYATRTEARFEVRDFFAADTDFVVGLDRFDELIGQTSGEPATVYVEGPLHRPRALVALARFVDALRRLDSDRLARDAQGQLLIDPGVLAPLGRALDDGATLAAVAAATGVTIGDRDRDRIPDSAAQVTALYRHLGTKTGDVLWRAADGTRYATRIELRLPGTRAQGNIVAARAAVARPAASLEAALRAIDPTARVVFTGAPIARQATLDAIDEAFRRALPVSLALCLVIAATFMRSVRFAAVSTVPVLLVVAWLYGLMYALDYRINVVTATIGAVSIGVGVDFAVHFTMRFREELAHQISQQAAGSAAGAPALPGPAGPGRAAATWSEATLERGAPREAMLALEAAGAGTGGALFASATSSVVGFTILAFAPMPMFAAYGLLTAVMIALASVASLVVLPALLLLVTRRR